jgi:parallel beta-helix repeat protein
MRKIAELILILFSITIFLNSCKKETDNIPPILSVVLMSESEYGKIGDTISYLITVSDENLVEELRVMAEIDGDNTDSQLNLYPKVNKYEYNYFYVIPSNVDLEGDIGITFTALDKDANEATIERTISTELVLVHSTKIVEDETWSKEYLHIVNSNLLIENEATLNIGPGTTIRFNRGCGIQIDFGKKGGISAFGTIEEPILFTANSLNKMPGLWKGLEFESTTKSYLEYCKIEYAGNSEDGAISINFGDVSVNNCTISDILGYGIRCWGGLTSFSGNLIERTSLDPLLIGTSDLSNIGENNILNADDTNKGIRVMGGTIEEGSSMSIKKQDVPYILTFQLLIKGELTIDPGVRFLFEKENSIPAHLYVLGSLNANGTENERITFALSELSEQEQWAGIRFEKVTTESILNYCDISHATCVWGSIFLDNTKSFVTITNSRISNSTGHGIYVFQDSSPILINNTFSNNADGDTNM